MSNSLDEIIVVKVTSKSQKYFKTVAEMLQTKFTIFLTSPPIYDKISNTYHVYFNMEEH